MTSIREQGSQDVERLSERYFKAFVDLVHYMQTQQPAAAATNAPIAAERITEDTGLFQSPDPHSPVELTLHAGAQVYPTGERNGV